MKPKSIHIRSIVLVRRHNRESQICSALINKIKNLTPVKCSFSPQARPNFSKAVNMVEWNGLCRKVRNNESTMVSHNRASELNVALRVKPGSHEVNELFISLHPLQILCGASMPPPILSTEYTTFSFRQVKKWSEL